MTLDPALRPCRGCGNPVGRSGGRRPRSWCSERCAQRNRSRVGRVPVSGNRHRVCEVCRAEYVCTYTEQRTCGRKCGVVLRKTTPVDRVCKTCGGQFVSVGAGQPGNYCRPQCRPGSIPQPRQPQPAREVTCGMCGTVFASKDAKYKYCGSECSRRARRRRDLVRYGKTLADVEWCHRCGVLKDLRRRKYCGACAAVVEQEWTRAARRRRKARQRGAVAERYTLSEIAERDRRTCQLCRKRVAMTKAVPHPRAPTIDHVIPLADGGDDTRANVQLAHFMCNSIKSAGGTQQLALIG